MQEKKYVQIKFRGQLIFLKGTFNVIIEAEFLCAIFILMQLDISIAFYGRM